MKDKFVLVTTDSEKRGVFAGIFVKRDGEQVTLKECRNAVYWSTDVRGFLGLAASGPTINCRISKAVPEIQLDGVTSITLCSDEAKAAWEKEPWS